MNKSLIGIASYESPEQVRNVTKSARTHEWPHPGRKFEFDAPVDERIIEWLEDNTLARLTQAMPGHYSSDYTYLLQGRNGVTCAIYPERIDAHHPNCQMTARDHQYHWKLTIRYQPPERGLPKELTDVLEELGFKEIEPASE